MVGVESNFSVHTSLYTIVFSLNVLLLGLSLWFKGFSSSFHIKLFRLGGMVIFLFYPNAYIISISFYIVCPEHVITECQPFTMPIYRKPYSEGGGMVIFFLQEFV